MSESRLYIIGLNLRSWFGLKSLINGFDVVTLTTKIVVG